MLCQCGASRMEFNALSFISLRPKVRFSCLPRLHRHETVCRCGHPEHVRVRLHRVNYQLHVRVSFFLVNRFSELDHIGFLV